MCSRTISFSAPRVNHFETRDSKEGAAITLTTYPGLNCLDQDDPGLIQALRSDILYPPSKTGKINPSYKILSPENLLTSKELICISGTSYVLYILKPGPKNLNCQALAPNPKSQLQPHNQDPVSSKTQTNTVSNTLSSSLELSKTF